MKSKLNASTYFYFLFFLGLFALVTVNAQTSDLTSEMTRERPDLVERQRKLDETLKIPIDFYGKAVDENGQPVSGATAKISVMGEVGKVEGLTKYSVISDQNGLFSLKGIHAMSVMVTVSKDGYHTLPDKAPPGGWSRITNQNITFPTENSPAVFPLKKKAIAEPLIVLNTNAISVGTDGTPFEFNLEKGRVVKNETGTFRVQTWVDAHDPKSNQPYHWKFRVTIPGGGLQIRTNEHGFTAPSSGYQGYDEVDMAPGSANWGNVCNRNYFVKLADGKYGRISLSINTKSFFVVDGYLNPSSSQNLEFDPSKRLEPRAKK
jgi:hypothetical protein